MPDSHLLTTITLAPIAAGVLLALLPSRWERTARWTALVVSIVIFGLALRVWAAFDALEGGLQMVEKWEWLPQLGSHLHFGVDGISLYPMLFTTLLIPLLIVTAWGSVSSRVKAFHVCVLLGAGSVIGVFLALDAFLFFSLWEFSFVPLSILVAVCGGRRRIFAAFKFLGFSAVGSAFLFVAILAMARIHFLATGVWTFDMSAWRETAPLMRMDGLWSPQMLVFLALAAAFAVRAAVVPLHSWLFDVVSEGPRPFAAFFATIFLASGAYAFLRLNRGLLPDAWAAAAPTLAVVSIILVLFGALRAVAENEIGILLASLCLSHLGVVLLGFAAGTPTSTWGAVLHLVNFSVALAALHLLTGFMREGGDSALDRGGHGAAGSGPLGACFFFAAFASIGLPGLNCFISTLVVLTGAWSVFPTAVVAASVGLLLAAAALMRPTLALLRTDGGCEDLSPAVRRSPWTPLFVLPLLALILWMGMIPRTFYAPMEAAVRLLLE